MDAADQAERFLSPDEFRQVLDMMRGVVVADTRLGKPFQEVKFGQENWYELTLGNRRQAEFTHYDFELSIETSWRIVKQSRTVSRSDMRFTFALGPFKRTPSFASLRQAVVAAVIVRPNLDLSVSFTDGQELLVNGMLMNQQGTAYANWILSTITKSYHPTINGRIEAFPTAGADFLPRV